MGGKIFGIGLSRTGTTSLSNALRLLGLKTAHFPSGLEAIQNNDASTDTPVAGLFKELDGAFPGSKFILTVREKESWLASCEIHWRRYQDYIDRTPGMADLYRQVLGSSTYDRDVFAAAYDRHERNVRNHFAGRELELLIMDLCVGEGWEVLCPFLGRKIPAAPFPNANRSAAYDRLILRLLKVTGDPRWMAEAADVSPSYVAHLEETEGKDHDQNAPIPLDSGDEFRLLLRNARRKLGCADDLAAALKAPVSEIIRIFGP